MLITTLLANVVITASNVNIGRLFGSVRVFLTLFIFYKLLGIFFMQSNGILTGVKPVPVASSNIHVTVLCTYEFITIVVIKTMFLTAAAPATVASTFRTLLGPFTGVNIRTRRVTLIVDLTLQFLPALKNRTGTVISTRSTQNNDVRAKAFIRHVGTVISVVVPIFTKTVHRTSGLDLTLSTQYCRRNVTHAR